MQLDPSAVNAGVRLIALGSVGSTNDEALRRRNERGPVWITAEAQTAGRGRLGRPWSSPPGNLYASLLLHQPSAPERAPELAFVAALALREAIAAAAPALLPQLGFKWPNDLLLAGGKCAGILIDGEVDPDKSLTVVVGVGVNCVSHPVATAMPSAPRPGEPLLYPATDLRAHGAEVTAARLFQRLSATMCVRLDQWNRGAGISAILSDWVAAAHGLGEEIHVGNGGVECSGRFVGVDQSGRLILQRQGGAIEKISAGDVFLFAERGTSVAVASRQG